MISGVKNTTEELKYDLIRYGKVQHSLKWLQSEYLKQLKICFNSTTLKRNQIHELQVKEGITDLKSERLQSDQQQEQDIKFLTKKKKRAIAI